MKCRLKTSISEHAENTAKIGPAPSQGTSLFHHTKRTILPRKPISKTSCVTYPEVKSRRIRQSRDLRIRHILVPQPLRIDCEFGVLVGEDAPWVPLVSWLSHCLRAENVGPCAAVDVGGEEHALFERRDCNRRIRRSKVDVDIDHQILEEDVFQLREYVRGVD